jgi:hypothetical protein
VCRTGNNACSIKKKISIDIEVTQRICKQLEVIECIYLKLIIKKRDLRFPPPRR